jgi:CxxC motif-containing protein (DUF1111 family)
MLRRLLNALPSEAYLMNRRNRLWYLLVALVALAPLGMRVATWSKQRSQPLDATMAEAGEMLFKHEWLPNDPLCNGGDGLGPVYNASSCLACHHQGGVGGSGGLQDNVMTFTVQAQLNEKPREGVVHARAVQFQETLAQVHPELPNTPTLALNVLLTVPTNCDEPVRHRRMPPGVQVSQRNTPALFGAKLIDDISDRDILAHERSARLRWGMAPSDRDDLPVGRALRLADGRLGKFGWKGQSASLSDFVQAACANELGLGNPGHAQPAPLGKPDYQAPALDLTIEQCNQLTAFISSLPTPVERVPQDGLAEEQSTAGKKLFHGIGCADCHTPSLGSVEGIYSDLLLHRMGQDLEGGGSYNDGGSRPVTKQADPGPRDGPAPSEWRTPPLWGVADSAPYMHDGRAKTLEGAIKLHGGQGSRAATHFGALSGADQAELIAFLKTLRAP